MKFAWFQSLYINERFMWHHQEFIKTTKYRGKRVFDNEEFCFHHNTVTFPIDESRIS